MGHVGFSLLSRINGSNCEPDNGFSQQKWFGHEFISASAVLLNGGGKVPKQLLLQPFEAIGAGTILNVFSLS